MIVFHCMGTDRVQALSHRECNISLQPRLFFPGCLSVPSVPVPPAENPRPRACLCVLFMLLPHAEDALEKALWSLHADTTSMRSSWRFPHLNGFLRVPVASPEPQFDSDAFLPLGRARCCPALSYPLMLGGLAYLLSEAAHLSFQCLTIAAPSMYLIS